MSDAWRWPNCVTTLGRTSSIKDYLIFPDMVFIQMIIDKKVVTNGAVELTIYRVGIKFRYGKQRLFWGCFWGYDQKFLLLLKFYVFQVGKHTFAQFFHPRPPSRASNIILVPTLLARSNIEYPVQLGGCT